MLSLKNYLCALNLFAAPEGAEPESNHQQRNNVLATRVYLFLLFIIFVALIIALSAIPQTTRITIENPTRSQFESLPDAICPCSRTSLSYGEFVSAQPSFHQVCSSDFISDRWISSLYSGINSTYFLPIDVRSSGYALFQTLASFCQLAQANVNQILSLLGSTSFMSSFVIPESVVQLQVQDLNNQTQLMAPNTLQAQLQLISNLTMRNKIMNGLGTSTFITGVIGYITMVFNIYIQNNGTWCTCMEDTICSGLYGIYTEFDFNTLGVNDFTAIMTIPGLSSGCMPVDSSRQSSLECFFNQTCINAIIPYLATPDANFTAMNPLLSSRFDVNSEVDSIVSQLMVEEWGFSISYDKYYTKCAPLTCTYSRATRNSFGYVLTTFISLLGGLCTGLAIVVPLIIRSIRRPPKTNSMETVPRVPCEYISSSAHCRGWI